MEVDRPSSYVKDPVWPTLAGAISAPHMTTPTSTAPLSPAGGSQISVWSLAYLSAGGILIAAESWSPAELGSVRYFWISQGAEGSKGVSLLHRGRELRFRETRRDLFKSLAGQWVCLEGETIAAYGSDPARVVEEARKKGVQLPYVFRVSKEPENSVRMGL